MSVYYPQAAMVLSIRFENFEGEPISTEETTELFVVPRDISVEINSYAEADTFSATLDYKTFPFDPRTIRAIGVLIYMDNTKSLFADDGTQKRVRTELTGSNAVFVGFVDEETITLNESERTVSMEGRDNTSFFLDKKRDFPLPINLKKRIDGVFNLLLKEMGESVEKIRLEVRGIDVNRLPVFSNLQKDQDPAAGKKNKRKGESYWDIMKRIARLSGLICYIDRNRLVLTPPRNFYAEKEVVKMIYGNNLKSLTYKRKIGRQKANNVVVYSVAIEGKGKNVAILPQDATDPVFIEKFGKKAITVEQFDADGKPIDKPKLAETLSFQIPDVEDRAHLIRVGEATYEQISRQHLEGSLSTNEMVFVRHKLGEDPRQGKAALFRDLRTGTAIEITIRDDDLEKIRSTSDFATRVDYLLSKNYPQEIATEFATSMEKIKYNFYTKSIVLSISQSEGFSIDIDFINFIELDKKALARKTANTKTVPSEYANRSPSSIQQDLVVPRGRDTSRIGPLLPSDASTADTIDEAFEPPDDSGRRKKPSDAFPPDYFDHPLTQAVVNIFNIKGGI